MTFLLWLDAHPGWYWTSCIVLSAGAAALAIVPAFSRSGDRAARWWEKDWVFLLAVALAMLAFRWPLFFYHKELNPDESAYISQAMTLQHDPIFWRSISAGTSGPLNIYPQAVLQWLGVPASYGSSRALALGLVVATLAIFYRTARRFAPPAVARLASLMPAALLALTANEDFTHCSSEHVPVLLLALASHLTLGQLPPAGGTMRSGYWVGVALGAVPFAKLQGSVVALVLAAFCALFFFLMDEPWLTRWKRWGLLVLGGLTVPVLLLSLTAACGAFEHFWQSYILINLGYTSSGQTWGEYFSGIPKWSLLMDEYVAYFRATLVAGAIGIGLLACTGRRRTLRLPEILFLVFTVVMLFASFFAAAAPRRHFIHYLLFTVFPLATWAYAGLGLWLRGSLSREARVLAVALWIAVGLVVQAADAPTTQQNIAIRGHVREFIGVPKSAVAQAVLHYAQPGESLLVWGWRNDLHVETGMWRATSDVLLEYLWNTTHKADSRESWLELIPPYFSRLYVEDARRTLPPVVVDAIALGSFGFWDRAKYGYETLPGLAALVQEHYVLRHEIYGTRIFVRKDRADRGPVIIRQ